MSSTTVPGYTAPIPIKKAKQKRGRKKGQRNEKASASDQHMISEQDNESAQSFTGGATVNLKPKQADITDVVTNLSIAVDSQLSTCEKPTGTSDNRINSFETTFTVEDKSDIPPLVQTDVGKPVLTDGSCHTAEEDQSVGISVSQAGHVERSVDVATTQEQPKSDELLDLQGVSDDNFSASAENTAPAESIADINAAPDVTTAETDVSMAPREMAESANSSTVEKNSVTSEAASRDISTNIEVVDKVQSNVDKAFPDHPKDQWDYNNDATVRSFGQIGDKKPENGRSSINHNESNAGASLSGKRSFNRYENKGYDQRDKREQFQHDNRGYNQNNYRGGGSRGHAYQNNFHSNGYRGRGRGSGGRVQGQWDSQRNQNRPYSGQERSNEQRHENYFSSQNSGNFQQQGYARDRQQQSGKTEHDYSYVPIPNDVELSKELVRIVRHGKYKWIKMNPEGYVSVDEVLGDHRFRTICGIVSFDRIKHIVETNDKKRFQLKEVNSKWFIKATQGHTVQVESLELTPITKPDEYPNVFHGTYYDSWDQIKVGGLNRMKRNHIHFAIGLPDNRDVISGMRQSSEVAIELDLAKAMKAGLKFFVSSNNVVLSEGDEKGRVHPKFFRRVVSLRPFQLLKFDIPPDFDQTSTAVKRSERATNPPADVRKSSERKGGSKGTEELSKKLKLEKSHQKETSLDQENKKEKSVLNPKAPEFVLPSNTAEKKQKAKSQEPRSKVVQGKGQKQSVPKKEQQPKVVEPEFEIPSASMTQEVTTNQTESSAKKGKKGKSRKR